MRFKLFENFNHDSIYDVSDNKIESYFALLKDADYDITITRGIRSASKYGSITNEYFYERLYQGEYNPAYQVSISVNRTVSDEDLTDEFKRAIYMLDKIEDLSYFADFDLNDIKINKSIYRYNRRVDSLVIYFYQKNKVNISYKDLLDFYKFRNCELIKDILYVKIPKDEILEHCIKDSTYKDWLENPDLIYESAYNHDYQVDIVNIIKYTLNVENKKKLADYIIKEIGEDELRNYDGELEEGDLSDRLAGDNKLFINVCENFDLEIIDEIRSVCTDYELSAQASKNYEETEKEFIRKIEYEVDALYKDEHFYVPIGGDYFIDKHELDELMEADVLELYQEDLSNLVGYFELKPYLSDYGDVDNKGLNEEIASMLK